MAIIQNSQTIKEIRKAAGLSISDGFPQRIADAVIPTIEVNPENFRIANVVENNNTGTTGSFTIYTTPSNKSFYLTGLLS